LGLFYEKIFALTRPNDEFRQVQILSLRDK
jgi:hypothetical protein